MKLFEIFKTGAWIDRFSNNKKKIWFNYFDN